MSDRTAKLRRSLARRLGDESVVVEPFRDGVDAFVDLVRRDGHPPAVVKSAKFERRLTSYEGLVDFGEGLRKEIVIARLLATTPVPVPTILAWHRSLDPQSEPSWLLTSYVEHEATTELPLGAQAQLGCIAQAIHAIQPTGQDLELLAAPSAWDEWVVDRIVARLSASRRYIRLPEADLFIDALRQAIAGRSRHARSLLHLDLRGPNVAIVGGEIIALFDWGNAIVGDPYFELARIRHAGGLTPAFLSGYGLSEQEVHDHEALLRVYGLDVTALLVVATKEEFEDEVLHADMAARTLATLESLVSR